MRPNTCRRSHSTSQMWPETEPRKILLHSPSRGGLWDVYMSVAHIPVVALSANAMPRDIEKGLQAGFFRYLTKPIKVNEFMHTLDVALEFARQDRPTS
jgi:CheY-like chemotaxis protein